MFGVKYNTWKSVCDMYFSLKTGSLKAYLQWFPFTKLTKADTDTISGEDFYNKYIKTGSFVLFPPAMHQSENFLQKSDGSFRDLCEMKRENYMAAFAYYKNYFDRVTADLAFVFVRDPRLKKPNYKGFYKESAFTSFYSEIDDSETVITKAHSLRNSNPLSHSSSELLDNNNTSNELSNSIKDLSKLIYGYIDKQKS